MAMSGQAETYCPMSMKHRWTIGDDSSLKKQKMNKKGNRADRGSNTRPKDDC